MVVLLPLTQRIPIDLDSPLLLPRVGGVAQLAEHLSSMKEVRGSVSHTTNRRYDGTDLWSQHYSDGGSEAKGQGHPRPLSEFKTTWATGLKK